MPEYVDREELSQILTQQTAILPTQEALWWQGHRVEPFVARFEGRWHYVVAREAEHVLLFADDEDEFGVGTMASGNVLEDYGLIGDLIDAVKWFLVRPA
ncbi:MAG: hypothetical protein ACREA9_04165 [Pyrinomonadaceae bacterium]